MHKFPNSVVKCMYMECETKSVKHLMVGSNFLCSFWYSCFSIYTTASAGQKTFFYSDYLSIGQVTFRFWLSKS